jgi:ABC-2 type transport system ATP-binding protein
MAPDTRTLITGAGYPSRAPRAHDYPDRVEAAVRVEGLVKRYGDATAVAGISFEVHPGEVFGLLGPNGAGKTTTVEILEGHREPTEGRVRVLGMDPAYGGREYRERIGIVLQSAGMERELTSREALSAQAMAYPRRRSVDDALELVGLEEKARSRVGDLSGGQLRRLDLALALIGMPELIFLDEPTTGFDPEARRESWRLVESLRELGTTVVLTTHYLDEAQNLADRVAVLAGGEIVASGPPDRIGADRQLVSTISFRMPDGFSLDDLPASCRSGATLVGREVKVTTEDATHPVHELTGWALERGLELDDLELTRPTLEDVYLEIVGAVK